MTNLAKFPVDWNNLSLIEKIALQPNRDELIAELAPTLEDKERLLYNYNFNARPKQLFPLGNWYTWLIKSGRGFGKTYIGANWVNYQAKTQKYPIAIIGKNAADVRDIQVELHESSIINVAPPWFKPEYQPSKRRLVWPNGVIGILYSGEEPGLLRGPQHAKAWIDELAKFQYPDDVWDNLVMGLRLGDNPQIVATTTPRPIPLIRTLAKSPTTIITSGSTFENRSNLAGKFLEEIIYKYDGTRLGRQELYGEILEDVPGALWTYSLLDKYRVKQHPELVEIVVAIDPAVSAEENSNSTGLIVAGKDDNDHGYLLEDCSGIYTPNEWATLAIQLYDKYQANRIIAEVNQGGDLVENNVQTTVRIQKMQGQRSESYLPFTKVHASKGKYARAEPVSTLYEKGHVHHVGTFSDSEDEMCNYLPGVDKKSPDRMDATVWAFTHLLVKPDVVEESSSSLW